MHDTETIYVFLLNYSFFVFLYRAKLNVKCNSFQSIFFCIIHSTQTSYNDSKKTNPTLGRIASSHELFFHVDCTLTCMCTHSRKHCQVKQTYSFLFLIFILLLLLVFFPLSVSVFHFSLSPFLVCLTAPKLNLFVLNFLRPLSLTSSAGFM